MKYTEAETDLHNAITSAVEGATGDAMLAMRIADTVVPDALNPTEALVRHLAEAFDAADMQHIGFHLYAPGSIGATFALRLIAANMAEDE